MKFIYKKTDIDDEVEEVEIEIFLKDKFLNISFNIEIWNWSSKPSDEINIYYLHRGNNTYHNPYSYAHHLINNRGSYLGDTKAFYLDGKYYGYLKGTKPYSYSMGPAKPNQKMYTLKSWRKFVKMQIFK